MTKSHKDPLTQRLLILGVPTREASQIVLTIRSWMTNNGPEWTVERLKALRQSYLKFLAGEVYSFANIAHRKTRNGPIPKGVWSKLWVKDDASRVTLSLAAFHIYTAITFDSTTPKQVAKFVNSCMVRTPSRYSMELITHVRKYGTKVGFKAKPYRRSLLTSFNSLTPRHQKKFRKDFSKAVDLIYQDELDLTGIIKGWGGFEKWFSKVKPTKSDGLVGNLGITQERGGKLRVFAFPNLLFQVMLNPLKVSLLRILKQKIPQDCTFNQRAGVEWVRTQMQRGLTIHSVDLSDATNHFPFDLQRCCLENIFEDYEWEIYLQLFEYVSRGKYGADAIGLDHVHWTRGQPLGTGPSFPAFAITHHAILSYCKTVTGKANLDCYRILGDDVVISDDLVYSVYRNVLSDLNCPISQNKSFSSMELAEFGGNIVYQGGILPGTKWSFEHVGNITNSALLLRHRGELALPPSWREIYRKWYCTVIENYAGIPRDLRDWYGTHCYLYQQDQKDKKEKKLKRSNLQSLYYKILESDYKNSFDPPDSETPEQEVDVVREPYGYHTLTVKVSATLVSNQLYSSMEDVKTSTSVWRPTFGTLRAFKNALLSGNLIDVR